MNYKTILTPLTGLDRTQATNNRETNGRAATLFMRLLLLVLTLTAATGAAWADEVTFSPSSMTCDGITISQASSTAVSPTYTSGKGLEFKVWSENKVSFVTNNSYSNISNIELVFQTTGKNDITLNYGVYSDAECTSSVVTGTFANASSNSTETTKSVELNNSGYVKVYVTSSKGISNAVSTTIKSIKVTYSASDTPTISITAHPESASHVQFTTVTPLSVTASASNGATCTYQWQSASSENGSYTDIDKATSSTYTVSNTGVSNKWYQCVVSADGCEAVTSSKAHVEVTGGNNTTNDLTKITENYICTPDAAIPLGTLTSDGKILSAAGGCNYSSNGLNIKDNRYIAISVAAGATLSVQAGNHGTNGDRTLYISKVENATNESSQVIAQGATETLTLSPTEENVYYIHASSDLYVKNITVTFPSSEPTIYTVTATSNITPELTGTGTQPNVVIKDASDNVVESGTAVDNGSTVTFTAVPGEGIVVGSIRNHFVFQKWDDETTTNPYSVTVNGADINRTAYFVRDHHTITYNANGGVGTTPDPINYECGTFVSLASTEQVSLTKTGYTFWGWNINGTIYGTPVGNGVDKSRSGNNFNKDWTATANWIANSYIVTYEANGGTVDPTSQIYTYDGDALEIPVPTKDGYIFAGWFTAADGGTQVTEIGTTYKPTENITLYAHWEEGKVYLQVTENGLVYNLTKANIDDDDYSATSQTSNKKKIKVDGVESEYYRTKKSTDYVSVNVQGAKAVVLDVAGGKEGSEYGIIVNDGAVEKFYMGGSTATSDPVIIPAAGASIKFVGGSGDGGDLYPVKATFYTVVPSVIKVKEVTKNVSSAILYWNQNAEYDVTTNNTGSVITMTTTVTADMADVAFNSSTGKLTINPRTTVQDGDKGTITLSQAAAGDYAAGEKVINVEFKWDSYTFSYNPTKIQINLNTYDKSQNGDAATIGDIVLGTASRTFAGVDIPAFPTLTVKKNSKDGENANFTVTDEFLKSLNYTSDDHTLAVPGITGGGDKNLTVKDGRQGIVTITATRPEGDHTKVASAQYNIEVVDGFKTTLTNGNAVPKIQSTFTIKDASENILMDITLGGYKYGAKWTDKDDAWSQNGDKVKDFGGQGKKQYHLKSIFVDGYGPQAQAVNDSKSEKGIEKRGLMEWFSTSDVKPNGDHYTEFERIHPFSLPCRGAYLKINPKVNGTATVYVLQNGNLEFISNTDNSIETKADAKQSLPLGSGPRAYYWFDQDGWRIDPVDGVDPVAKQPLTIGRDHTYNVVDPDDQNKDVANTPITNEVWNEAWTRFCTNDSGLKSYLTNVQPGRSTAYWLSESEIADNIALGDNMKPQDVIPYQKGWMVMQKCYVKYVINVLAGKTYYFFSNASKLGYSGVNFKPNNDIKSDGVTTIDSYQDKLPLIEAYDQWTGTNDAKTIKEVELTGRTFTAGQWNTICLPFAVDEDQVQAIFGNGDLIPDAGGAISDKTKEVQLMVYNGWKDGTIYFLRHVDQNILAGQPYLIRPTKTVTSPTFHNVTIPENVKMVDYGATDLYNGKYSNGGGYFKGANMPSSDPLKHVGTFAPTLINNTDFYVNVNNGNIYEFNGDSGTLKTYRSYLKQESYESPARALSIGFSLTGDEESGTDPSGIMQLLIDNGMDYAPASGIYNINGQKVAESTSKLSSGLYIVKGKKIVIK